MKSPRPRIDVNTYKTPTNGWPDGVSCAVLNLSPDEAKIIEGLARRIAASRNSNDDIITCSISWVPDGKAAYGPKPTRDEQRKDVPGAAARRTEQLNEVLPLSVVNSEAGTRMGWMKRYNTPMWRTEYISPDGTVYIDMPGSKDMIMRADDQATRQLGDVVEPKAEPPATIDRFSGLDLT